jgi:hypothetical protein
MEARRRIAMQMIANSRKGYPKNIGEGLTAIGDAFGDRAVLNQLMKQEGEFEKGVDERIKTVPQGPESTPQRTSDVSSDRPVTARPVTTARDDTVPATGDDTFDGVPVRAVAAMPPAAATNIAAAAQPSSVLVNPNMPRDLGGTSSALTPQQSAVFMNPQPTALPAKPLNMFPHDPINGDAPPGGRTDAVDPMARNRLAALVQNRTAQGVPPQNPMLAGSVPRGMGPAPLAYSGSVDTQPDQRLASADTGTVSDAAPILPSGLRAAPPPPPAIQAEPPPVQLAQAMPPSIKPPSAPAEPVPAAPQFSSIPALPPKSPDQLKVEALLSRATALGNVSEAETYRGIISRYEDARKNIYENALRKWEAEPGRAKAAQDAQQQAYQEKLTRRFGGLSPATLEKDLDKGVEMTAGIPQATQSIKRARDLVVNDKMFHGGLADTDVFLSKMMTVAGFPTNPKETGTEQFRTAMSGIMAQARKGITGPGTSSDRDMDILQKATAADAKLNPATIIATLDAAERLNLTMAIQHQKKVRNYAGEDDPDRQRTVYGAYGVPNMVDLVPQYQVDRLLKYEKDPKVLKDFDDTFHTPGLSRDILRMRRPR